MDTMKDTKMQPATDAVIEELRMLAEDLYVNGYNRYSSAMSQAADELERLRAKVEQMERQELGYRERCTPSSPAGGSNRFPLYALPGAQPAPSVPDGWLRAIDEALVTAHIGIANAHDTYEQAKAKLDSLIGFHTDVATDPAVNGGFKLMLDGWEANLLIVEHAMRMNNWDWNSNMSDDLKRSAYKIISNLLAAPEAKP